MHSYKYLVYLFIDTGINKINVRDIKYFTTFILFKQLPIHIIQ